MELREEVIKELEKKYDPRSARWEYRAIMDTLQDCEDKCTMKDLEGLINEKYGCKLFTYSALYTQAQSLIELGVIQNNPITKKLCLKPEYIIIPETKYLPLSNYNVTLFALSGAALAGALYVKSPLTTDIIITVVTGAAYLLFQYIGSEWAIPKFGRNP